MNALQAQIAKAQAESKAVAAKGGSRFGKNKYLKRSQLEEAVSSKPSAKRQKLMEEKATASEVKGGPSGEVAMDDIKGTGGRQMTEKQIVKELRQRREPIRFFGETDDERLRRLRQLQILQPDIDEGLRNEYMDAMNKVDDDFIESAIKGNEHEKSAEEKAKLAMVPDWNEVLRMTKGINQGDDVEDRKRVQTFLKYILDLWEAKLYQMPTEQKRTSKGRESSAKHAQATAAMKPLFRELRKNTVDYSIARFLAEIVQYMSEREYVKASDAYLRMAIGKSEWPIGVTMVGIHERSAREKIFSQKMAHVLNDETKRKYIQSLKRILTVMQRIFPTTPSKSIDFDDKASVW